jgi:hypothetical protein
VQAISSNLITSSTVLLCLSQVTALLRLSMQIERLHAEADEADEEGDSVAAAEMRGRAAELQVGVKVLSNC